MLSNFLSSPLLFFSSLVSSLPLLSPLSSPCSVNLFYRSDCVHVTDKGLALLPQQLEHLVLDNCHNITDEGISYLPSTLVHLSLHGCGECVTDECLQFVAQYLPNLQTLNVQDCGVTEEGKKLLPAVNLVTEE